MSLETFTMTQLANFIRKQPDGRPVRMDEPTSDAPVGCVLVHYAKEVLGVKHKFTCGTYCISPLIARGDKAVSDFIDGIVGTLHPASLPITYGELKAKLTSSFLFREGVAFTTKLTYDPHS